jgi:hypothetical protein
MKGNVFRIAKHLVNGNRDVVGASRVKDSIRKIMIRYLMRSSLGIKKVLKNVRPVYGPSERTSALEVDAAIGKIGKIGQLVQHGLCRGCSRLQAKLLRCG